MELDIWYYLAVKKYDAIYNRTRYMINQKKWYFKTYYKIDSFDYLLLEKTMTYKVTTVTALTKLVFKKYQNH